MNRHVFGITLWLAMLVGWLTGAAALAEDRTLEQINASFRARYPKLLELKHAGKIGEIAGGFVDAVKPEYLEDAAVKKVIDEENADRRELYKLMAKEQGTSTENVAKVNTQRKFDKAGSGEYLKGADGVWRQK